MSRPVAHYFGAGPALLPTDVLEQAAKDLVNYQSIGIGAGEISHRSAQGVEIIDKTKENLTKLLNIPDTHEVFFLQGGGTGGFSNVATNLGAAYLKKTGKVGKPGYVITGSWSKKAYEEAERLGLNPVIISQSKATIAPVSEWDLTRNEELSYVYHCENETVDGVEFNEFPFEKFPNVEVVTDMSSNFLSKKIDVSKYGLIFAGAQKNVGIAGVSIYIIKKSLLEQASPAELLAASLPVTPIAFDYPTVVKNNSAYNTIPTFVVLIVKLVLEKLVANGGLSVQEESNKLKAEALYAVLDKYEIFKLPVDKKDRSKMNVVFTLDGDLDGEFIKGATEKGLTGLKGHRSVGGMRASLYNAVSLESVELLVQYCEDFAKAH